MRRDHVAAVSRATISPKSTGADAPHQRTQERRLAMTNQRRITVARPGALGDTLLTLPALALLRRWAPDARLTFIARADTLPLVSANGLADVTASWNLPDWGVLFDDMPELTPRARAALVDAEIVIVWADDPDIAPCLARLGVKQALVAPALPPDGDIHAAEWLAETLRPLGAPSASRVELARLISPLRSSESDRAWADNFLRDRQPATGVVALHPGSGSQAKRWPAASFAEVARLAREAGYTPLLLAGEADTLALAETEQALRLLGVSAELVQGATIGELVALFRRCVGYVGCDSGISHLAALCGTPTVAVFGPTDPRRWAPLGPHALALRAPDGRLEALTPSAVWALMRSLIAE